MRLAIAEAGARDNSYKTNENAEKIQDALLNMVITDSINLEKTGWKEGTLDTEAGKFTITYEGDDYKNACNDNNAMITYTITLGQKSIEVTDIVTGIKGIDGSDMSIDVGGDGATISKTDSYVGCYANLDDDPEPEGIIYADLAKKVSEEWGTTDTNKAYGAFSYGPVTGTKDYYISTEKYEGTFGIDAEDKKRYVITVKPGSTGADRFYVMALEDFTTADYTRFSWYFYGNISDYKSKTSTDFGTGKINTANMIAAWNVPSYGEQHAEDMWGLIQEKVAEGWFVPSRGEWGAFGSNLGITSDNGTFYGLSSYCWSSSLYDTSNAWYAHLSNGYMRNRNLYYNNCVRLSATF